MHANLSVFSLLTLQGNVCQPTEDSRDLPGNTATVMVQGPPVAIPTNSGGSTGIVPISRNGIVIDKAYIAVPSSGAIAVLNADASASTPPLTDISMPAGYSPTATAANPVSLQVFVISYTSPIVVLIDAQSDSVMGTITLPVKDNQGFSGGACTVCGVVADPVANQAIFDTADGYFVFDVKSNQIVQSISDHTAENFGYNPFTRQLLNPFYGAPFFSPVHGVDVIDLGANSVSPIGNIPSTVFKPDSAALDYTTNVAVVANEAEAIPTGVLAFLNLEGATSTGAQVNVPLATYTFPDATNFCSGGSDSSEWTMLAIDAATHLLFFANEFSDCAGVLNLPPVGSDGVPQAASTVRFGELPTSPDGQAWANSLDPHGTAVFVSVVDGHSYGFLIRRDAHYVARIDLQRLFEAQVLTGTQNVVDLHSIVVFLPTLPNEP